METLSRPIETNSNTEVVYLVVCSFIKIAYSFIVRQFPLLTCVFNYEFCFSLLYVLAVFDSC